MKGEFDRDQVGLVAVSADPKRHLRAIAVEPPQDPIDTEPLLVGVVGRAEASGIVAVGVDLKNHVRRGTVEDALRTHHLLRQKEPITRGLAEGHGQ